ncbi:M56 family metallopeptidase [Streptomyces sp. S.PB5]|uniref:M56 family metallopeptidase n=1 Tax=Streptomyces sp. S.PB5 TaxID=3020844 RepID=UPI0025AF6052|nr:M56 family metallopeptidase [Streptomyces sp. S.PB5]MDN3021085.1 M56 family metallopeptidase [Streptomyces sp. S.PB5]
MAGQRVRHHLLVGVVVCVALLDAGLIATVVAGVAGFGKAGLVILVMVGCAVAVTCVVVQAQVSGAVEAAEDGEWRRRPTEAVGRLAPLLGMRVPRVRVVAEETPYAFVCGYGAGATVVFSSGLVELCGDDEARLEAITAHELATLAGRGATLTRLSYCLLGWALFAAHLARRLVTGLHVSGRSLRGSASEAADRIHRYDGQTQDDYLVTKGSVFLITKAIGVALHLAALCLLVFCGVPWLIAGVTRRATVGRRVLDADAISVRLTGDKQALIDVLALLGAHGAPREPARGGRIVQELSFLGPSEPQHVYWPDRLPPYPDVDVRIAELRALDDREPLVGVPVAATVVVGLLLLALLGGLGLFGVRLPFEEPRGGGSVAQAPVRAEPALTQTADPRLQQGVPGPTETQGGPTTGTSPAAPRQETTTGTTSVPRDPVTDTTTVVQPPDVPDDDDPPQPPDPLPPPARTELNTLSEARWNDFCGRKFGAAARFGQNAYDVGCVGVDRPFGTVTEVCDFEFPDAQPNVDRLGDFHNPRSWGCIAGAQLLGSFQLSVQVLEEQTGRAVVYHENTDPRAYGYTYADGSGISLSGVCGKMYGSGAVDRLLDVHNAHSVVECYRSAS